MANFVRVHQWGQFVSDLLLASAAKPTTNAYRAILCGAGTLSLSSTAADAAALELPAVGGYARQTLSFPTAGAAIGTNGGWQRVSAQFGWTPTAALQYRYLAIIANSQAGVGNTSGLLVGFYDAGALVTIAQGQTANFTYSDNLGA